jgi:hypothetical protein
MDETRNAALKRLRRKLEIMRLDLRAQNNARYMDVDEMLALVQIVEKGVSPAP